MRIGHCMHVALLLLGAPTSARAETAVASAGGGGAYASDYAVVARLGQDLRRMLEPRFRALLATEPVALENSPVPMVRGRELRQPGEPEPRGVVVVSDGFVDLLNYVAHAQAINLVDRGFFDRYMLSLSRRTRTDDLTAPAQPAESQYWTRNLMNEQLSSFNQMVGMLVAIEMAHHYLGHYRKYAARLVDSAGQPVPIGALVTPDEWERTLRAAAANSLNAGLGIDGVVSLFSGLEKMPTRPAWTAYFLPRNTTFSRIRKLLEKEERDYFAGRRH